MLFLEIPSVSRCDNHVQIFFFSKLIQPLRRSAGVKPSSLPGPPLIPLPLRGTCILALLPARAPQNWQPDLSAQVPASLITRAVFLAVITPDRPCSAPTLKYPFLINRLSNSC